MALISLIENVITSKFEPWSSRNQVNDNTADESSTFLERANDIKHRPSNVKRPEAQKHGGRGKNWTSQPNATTSGGGWRMLPPLSAHTKAGIRREHQCCWDHVLVLLLTSVVLPKKWWIQYVINNKWNVFLWRHWRRNLRIVFNLPRPRSTHNIPAD